MISDLENWEQLQTLFHIAEDTGEESLDAVLAASCSNSDLRLRAKALVLASRCVFVPSLRSTPSTESIGPYTVLRHLGSGGICAVYLVERHMAGTVRRSALKVLSLQAAGSFFVERFAREQLILASLDHPNITRMFDTGISDSGQPYLVMEYVDGAHLDRYCDDHALGIPDRLGLFLGVCDAVAYAHRNLIVHLDLKPSNIMVAEAEGTIKLLDFGTSRLIQPGSLLTTTVMATPAYASPEQLRNEPVSTACDVYALGALLFELLSGRRHHEDTSIAAMIDRTMHEIEPQSMIRRVTMDAATRRGLTPRKLVDTLRGDLETITSKCLSPRPRDRYISVDALSLDIQRYLSGRPTFCVRGRQHTATPSSSGAIATR